MATNYIMFCFILLLSLSSSHASPMLPCRHCWRTNAFAVFVATCLLILLLEKLLQWASTQMFSVFIICIVAMALCFGTQIVRKNEFNNEKNRHTMRRGSIPVENTEEHNLTFVI